MGWGKFLVKEGKRSVAGRKLFLDLGLSRRKDGLA